MPPAAPDHDKRLARVTAIRCLAVLLSFGLLLPAPHNTRPAHAGSVARIAHYEPLNSLTVDRGGTPGVAGKASISATTTVSFEAYGRLIVLDLVKNDRLIARLKSKLPIRDDQFAIYKGSIRSVPGSWARLSIDEHGIGGVVWDGTELLLIDQLGRLEGLQVGTGDKGRTVVVRLADIELAIDKRIHPATSAASMSAASLIGEATTRARKFAASEGLTSRAISLGAIIATTLADSLANIEQGVIGWTNVADGIFTEQVDIHLDLEELINLDGLPDPFTSTNPNVLLSTLANFKSSDARLAPLGLTHLLTRNDLDGLVRGIALYSSACGPSKGIGLTEARGSYIDALIMTHEIAHNLGAPHDNEFGSACAATPDGFLMSPTLNGSSVFSACSVNRMSAFLNTATCIVPVTFSELQLDTPVLPTAIYYKGSFPLDLSVQNIGIESVVDGQFNISGNGVFDVIVINASNRDCLDYDWDSEASCDLDNLYPGETIIVQTEISPQATGQQTLDIVASASNDTDRANNGASLTIDVIPATELFVDGVNLTNIVTFQGGSVTYTLSVTNVGDLATTAVVQLRTGPVHSLEGTGNCVSPGAGQLDCDLGTLGGGSSAGFDFTVHVGSDLGLDLDDELLQYIDVTLDTSLHDTARFPGQRFLFGVYGAFYDLDVGFSEPPVTIMQGERRELVAYVTNHGPDPVPDLDLSAYVEPGVELGSPVADRGSCTLVGQLAKCEFGQFDPGEFVSLRIPYTGIDAREYVLQIFPEMNGGHETSDVYPNIYARFKVTSAAPPPPPPPPPVPSPATKSGGGGESWLWLLALLALRCCQFVKRQVPGLQE